MSRIKLCHGSSYVTDQVMSRIKLYHGSSYVTDQVLSRIKLHVLTELYNYYLVTRVVARVQNISSILPLIAYIRFCSYVFK